MYFPFTHTVGDGLALQQESVAQVVAFESAAADNARAEHTGIKTVSGVLEVFADAAVALGTEPVFATDVECFAFLCFESGELEREFVVGVEVVGQGG